MPRRIFLINTIKDGKVGKLYFAHGQAELEGYTKALHKRGHNTEAMEVSDAFYHNQVFDITELLEKRKRMKELMENREIKADRRIKCLETGEVCINAKQFAEYMGIYPSSIYNSVTYNRTINGYTFVFTSEPITIEPKEYKTNTRRSTWPGAFRIYCIETGEQYECVRDAARDLKISMQQVYNSIRSGRPRAGFTFLKMEE